MALAGIALVAVAAFLVFGGSSGIFNPMPTYPSLRDHPDPSISGTVAYTALGEATPQGKRSCVEAVAAGGGNPVQLFCVYWGKERTMAPSLRFRPDGQLDATSVDTNHWRKLVDVASGRVSDVAWTTPSASTDVGPQGQVVQWHVTLGTLTLTMTSGTSKRTLLRVAVPREYSLSRPQWSPSGAWFTVVDNAARILVVTTDSTPSVRFLADGEGPAVTDRAFARLAPS
ncbi:MAG TPA: hypothetical protein VLS91_07235 [Acidimicrobiales bacterium]|nr:hypothetical protein [Acidimicrobiales bacterium]